MSEFTDHLTDDHHAFIEKQPVFFIASAAPDARINLSPKGMDSFRVLDATRIDGPPVRLQNRVPSI